MVLNKYNEASLWTTALVIIIAVTIITPIAMAGNSVVGENTSAQPTPEFQIVPIIEQGKGLDIYTSRLDAYQMSDNDLQKMQTEELIEVVLDYPRFGDMFTYNEMQMGFDSVARNFNGLNELISRKDAYSKLLHKYESLDPNGFNVDWTPLQKGNHMAEIRFVEMMLAQDTILDKLSSKQINELISEALSKRESRQTSIFYQDSEQRYTALLIGRSLRQIDSTPVASGLESEEAIDDFVIRGSIGLMAAELNNIFSHAAVNIENHNKEVLSAMNVLEDPPESPYGYGEWGYFDTPCGDEVKAAFGMPDPPTAEQQTAWDVWWYTYLYDYFPCATMLESPTYAYNCHGYAWYRQSTTNNSWIGSNGVCEYFDCYDSVPSPDLSVTYNLIYWNTAIGCSSGYPNHSARGYLTSSSDGVFISKWGSGPLVQHGLNDCPYADDPDWIDYGVYYELPDQVDISVNLQGEGSRPNPSGYQIPGTVKFYNSAAWNPDDGMPSATPVYEFNSLPGMYQSGVTTQFTCSGISAGLYDITVTSDTTLTNIKNDVNIAYP